MKTFCYKLKLSASRWRNFKYATVRPKCLSELRLTSVADEATALDSDDEMDEDGHVNEENEAPLEHGSNPQSDYEGDDVWFYSSDNDAAAKEDGALEHGPNQHEAVVAADVPFSADENDAAMSLVCVLRMLQNGGMSSEQEQLRNEEEVGRLEEQKASDNDDNDFAKEDGALEQQTHSFSADENVAAMSLVCLDPMLQNQNGGMLCAEQEQEQLRNEEEEVGRPEKKKASATCESQTKLVMVQHKRGFRAQQIKICYRRKRKTALLRQANM